MFMPVPALDVSTRRGFGFGFSASCLVIGGAICAASREMDRTRPSRAIVPFSLDAWRAISLDAFLKIMGLSTAATVPGIPSGACDSGPMYLISGMTFGW